MAEYLSAIRTLMESSSEAARKPSSTPKVEQAEAQQSRVETTRLIQGLYHSETAR